MGLRDISRLNGGPTTFARYCTLSRRRACLLSKLPVMEENLDSPIYNQGFPDFPASWKNPFGVGGPNSGAIIVGAGNPPAGTHGRYQDTFGYNDRYVDRARCIFSNYGARVDCQGWGWEVATLGVGDLQPGGTNPNSVYHNRFYTDQFAGTSSASPMIVGALACIQGTLQANKRAKLTPTTARQLLRSEGSVQEAAPGRPPTQRIRRRPDLRKTLTRLLALPAV